MEAMLNDAISTINGYLWSYFIIFILIGAGLFFTMTTNFVQIRMIKEMIRLVINGAGSSTEKNHVSSFQAFCVSTASRVGVGNIAGIAIAVVLGGPGAIFWMWVIALIGAATGFIESTLAQIYKEPVAKGRFLWRTSLLYSVWSKQQGIICFLFAILISITLWLDLQFCTSQYIGCISQVFNLDVSYTGAVVAVLLGIIIFGGINRVAKASEIIVPIMAILYIATALFVVIMNITQFPHVIYTIFSSAFEPVAQVVAY